MSDRVEGLEGSYFALSRLSQDLGSILLWHRARLMSRDVP